MENRRVHFVGIGGIGVSALAQWFCSEGRQVSGSDLEASEITEELSRQGVKIRIGPHKAENVPSGTNFVIYSAAAKKNPEIDFAKKKRIKVRSYAEALGDLTKENLTIAIAGSHGKSTTTALVSLILIEAGFDPTVIIGTKLKEFTEPFYWRKAWLSGGKGVGSNFRKGKKPILVIEADEWNGSFWNYAPSLAIITNIDKEHLDFYKTGKNVAAAFKKFILRSVPGSRVVINADDPVAAGLGLELQTKYSKRFGGRIHYYSLSSFEAAAIRPLVALPGKHNSSNAVAAHTVAKILNIPDEVVGNVLASFSGAWRRFEEVGNFLGSAVIADYAHHPAEIKATIAAARSRFGGKKIIAVFQPHHYARTRDLFEEFTAAFDDADKVCLIDIYEVAGREKKRKDSSISSFHLAKAVAGRGVDACYAADPAELKRFLGEEAGPDKVILMMGAGSIWNLTKELLVYPVV